MRGKGDNKIRHEITKNVETQELEVTIIIIFVSNLIGWPEMS